MVRRAGARPAVIRRCAVVGFVALSAAVAVQLLGAGPVKAMNPAREGARDTLLRAVDDSLYHGDPNADYAAITDAWSSYADLSRLHTASPGDPVAAATFFQQACQPGGALDDFSKAEPAPGDLVLYHIAGESRDRLAMFVTPADVVLYNPATLNLEVRVRQEVTGYDGDGPRAIAGIDAHIACRFNAALLPGGGDDLTSPPGRVALADPRQTLEHAQWSYSHPRDPDHSVWHQVTKAVTGAASQLGGGLLWLVDHVGSGLRGLLEHLGPLGAGMLGAFDLTFDGRLLHSILTWGLLVMTGTWGLRLASRLGIPILGRLGDAVWGIGSFAVSLLTGVDDSKKVSVLGVAVNVLLTLTVVGKAAGVGARLGFLAARELAGSGASRLATLSARALKGLEQMANRGLGSLNHLANVIDVRPRIIVGMFRPTAARPAWWDVTDYVSWIWRPGHIASDLVSDAASGAGLLGIEKGELIGDYNKLFSAAHTLGTVSSGEPLSTPVSITLPQGPDSAATHVGRLLGDQGIVGP